MDLSGVLSGAFSGAVAGFFAGAIVGGIVAYAQLWRIDGLEARLMRMHNDQISPKGVAMREQKAERQNEAIAYAFELMEGKDGEKPDVKNVALQVASKYPDVAGDIIQKALQGKTSKLFKSFLGG